ncbi:HPr-rel-A system PqqD family peptide chaperone [Massilia sp. R2A-15]|uniref:HPr-rel-A system PqqD family peptide chaperone n=1 Tax=Massilia sp. R2A-15 TaxID=3064278 RepID=UPI0027358001|nr:HPr-rel-A system PqqD family peptide chaperone [Massilia sp. R2A-15]WLI88896.1 HPr-rel-A system PqqD family peptide chaperone [Massilia sp. R2A-15]
MIWRLAPGQTLRCREWQGEHVVYNDVSGDTHQLTDSAMHVLSALRTGPLDEGALAAGLRAEFDAEGGEVADADIAALLAALRAIALIEAVP